MMTVGFFSGREELQAVHLRPPHPDRHVEPVLAIRAFGERLVVAAVLGLCEPVGREHDALLRLSRCADERDRGDEWADQVANAIDHAGHG